MIKITIRDERTHELFISQPNKPIETTRQAHLFWVKETGIKGAKPDSNWEDYQHIEFYIGSKMVGAIYDS